MTARRRTFDTGADRDTSDHKIDFEGALSPIVLRRFGEYMRKHSVRQDGTRRSSDNWQKGMPTEEYMKSSMRHMFDAWTLHRGYVAVDDDGQIVDFEEALCGVMFNVMGILHERLKLENLSFDQAPDIQIPAGPSA